MDRRHLLSLLALAPCLRSGFTPLPASAAPGDTFLTPESAGPDFLIQGEYAGKVGELPYGAQVIALGNGSFECVMLRGGLPGAGWDRSDRVRIPGKRAGDRVEFELANTPWRLAHTGAALDFSGKGTLSRLERRSPTEGAPPPEGAVVLFDGKSTGEWDGARTTPEGWLHPGCRTRRSFKDFQMHLEFRLPFKPEARGQSRGNSGLYLFGRYEVQILDSFGLNGVANECGAIYRQKAPDQNMCFPPLAWQTYDVEFQSPRFDEAGKKVRNAVITVRHNGVAVHDRYELPAPTGGGQRLGETDQPGTINIQNHGNPVFLRNIWIVPR